MTAVSSVAGPDDDARLVFAGTPEFSLASLQALVRAGLRPVAVLTQPDRPSGRGRKLTSSPVKAWATDEGIPVLQPETLKDEGVQVEIARLRPDALVVAAYGLLLPPPLLSLPTVACINVHASLLPRWRGASPIQAAILAGDTVTGVSLMRMEAGLDTGPVYAQEAIRIGPEETGGELHDRLADLGAALLTRKLPSILAGELLAEPQPDEGISYAPRIRREDARIDWSRSAGEIARAIRAYNPWPVSHTFLDGELLRCWRACEAGEREPAAEPGTILEAGAHGILVRAGEGCLRLLEVQTSGRRRIAAADLANQRPLAGLKLD